MTAPGTQTPLVSVIIPCFNAERWIAETLQSVRSQDYPRVEIIVVDDGSTDRSLEVARAQPDVRVIECDHGGGNRARNTGFEASTGRYIQFLDADDLLKPNKLSAQVAALERGDADVAYGPWAHLEQEAEHFVPGEVFDPRLGDDILGALITMFWCPNFGYLYRREAVERSGGWDVNARTIQDVRFQLDVAIAGARYEHVPVFTGHYRRPTELTLSTRSAHAFSRGCYDNAVKLETHWRARGDLGEAHRADLVHVYGNVARFFYQHDRPLFEEVYGRILGLVDRYIPEGPLHLRAVSRLLGYRRAEAVAGAYRRIKGLMIGQTGRDAGAPSR